MGAAIVVRFACGHHQEVSETASAAPVCVCGERTVAHVTARAPRFRGACSGPYAETIALEPMTVTLATTPLVLKDEPS